MKTNREKQGAAKRWAVAIVPVDIFKRGVMVAVGDFGQLRAELRENGYELSEETEREIEGSVADGYVATTLPIGKARDVLVYAREPMSLAVLVHELCHAAQMILGHVGVNDKETFAYLVEHLFSGAVSCPSRERLLRDAVSLRHPSRTAPSSRRGRGNPESTSVSSAL